MCEIRVSNLTEDSIVYRNSHCDVVFGAAPNFPSAAMSGSTQPCTLCGTIGFRASVIMIIITNGDGSSSIVVVLVVVVVVIVVVVGTSVAIGCIFSLCACDAA